MEVEPTLRSAKESVTRLEKLQEEKSEKMKEEALGESAVILLQVKRCTLSEAFICAPSKPCDVCVYAENFVS